MPHVVQATHDGQPVLPAVEAQRSVRALGWIYFFLADIQTGVGPFLAAYLAASGWNARDTGLALTAGGLVTVCLSPVAGALVDRSRQKKTLIAVSVGALALGAALIALGPHAWTVGSAQILIGAAAAFLGPALAALTLGLVGHKGFDRQFGKNQAFNSAGNVSTALLLAAVSYLFSLRSIFAVAACLAIPVWITLRWISPGAIDDAEARGGESTEEGGTVPLTKLLSVCADRPLLCFLLCAFLFHFANAAMLPQLGEMLARGRAKAAAPFMSACIIVTQLIIAMSAASLGRLAGRWGRKPLLLIGFGVLPVRGVLYTVVHATAGLIAVQVLDGVANAIFGVVSTLVVMDRMRGTGHFNLAQGALATCVGLGAALSTTFGGMLIHRYSYPVSFLGLAGVAAFAVLLLLFTVPETRVSEGQQIPATC